MKSINALLVATALSASSLAMAEGGGERTFARMEQAQQAAMRVYPVAKQQKAEAPVAESSVRPVEHGNC
ncbi:co-regulatory protein PtrA N-terminal domain-containing protein [Pseudomonas zhanjiangensis]|uniref:Co-regulatory protein PtrA N-terminal domain-containing protein n=1 Tax=Pseudomonas zhanjiangensis TaxID=3239015 RepID=A0ABV3YQE3_9PSED